MPCLDNISCSYGRSRLRRHRLEILHASIAQVGDIVRKTSARVLKEGKSGDFEKKGHGEAPQHSTFSIEDSSLHRAHVRRHSMCVGSNTCTSPQTMRSGISGMFGPF